MQEGETVVASKMLTTIFRLLTNCEVRLVLEAAAMDAMLFTRDIVVWQLYLVFRDLPAGSLKRKYFITQFLVLLFQNFQYFLQILQRYGLTSYLISLKPLSKQIIENRFVFLFPTSNPMKSSL